MSAKLLTAAACDKAKTPGRIRDLGARALYFVVSPTGHKSFVMRFRQGRKTPKLTLGPFDRSGRELTGEPQVGQPLTLAAARQLCAEIHRQKALGRDPIADHKARRHRRAAELKERQVGTFLACARDYVEKYARKKPLRGWRSTAKLLGLRYADDGKAEPEMISGSLAERWCDKPVRDIEGHDAWSVVDEARQSAVPGTVAHNPGASENRARLLNTALSGLFGWLHRNRRVDLNPFAGLKPDLPVARDRVLTDSELKLFWQAADREPLVGPLLKLLALTGQRLGEVSGLRRSELSEDGTTWVLPAARAKNKRANAVPLSPMAQALIASVPNLTGSDLIFSTTGVTPVSGWSRTKRRLDKTMLALAAHARGDKRDAVIAPWRLHDLRRTVATGMAEIGIEPHIVEAVLNHVSGHKASVAGIYNRAAYAEQKKAALLRWSQHIDGLVTGRPAKILPLRK
jgi:integrase